MHKPQGRLNQNVWQFGHEAGIYQVEATPLEGGEKKVREGKQNDIQEEAPAPSPKVHNPLSSLSGATDGAGGAGSRAELPVCPARQVLGGGPYTRLSPAGCSSHVCWAGEPLWHLQEEEGGLSEPHRLQFQPASEDQAHHPARHTAAQFTQNPTPHPKIITSIMAVFSHLTSIAPNAPQFNAHKPAQFPLPFSSFPLPCLPAQPPFCL